MHYCQVLALLTVCISCSLVLQEPYADYRRHGGAVTPIQYVPGVPTTTVPQVGHTHSPTAGSVIWTDISHSTQRYGSVLLTQLFVYLRVLRILTHLTDLLEISLNSKSNNRFTTVP